MLGAFLTLFSVSGVICNVSFDHERLYLSVADVLSVLMWSMASHAQWAHKGIWHMIASFKQLNNCFSITTPPSLEENLAPGLAHNDYSPHWGPIPGIHHTHHSHQDRGFCQDLNI